MPDQRIQQRASFVRELHSRGIWPQYESAEEAIELLDWPTFNAGLVEFNIATRISPNESSLDEANKDGILFCRLPLLAVRGGGQCKWPNPNVTWHTIGTLPGLSADEFQSAIAEGFQWWANVCGIMPAYTANEKTANAVMYAKRIDGPSGVLAQSELPCGLRTNGDRQLTQEYDSERFVLADKPPQGRLDLVRIACHELGHLIGLEHSNSGGRALMDPTYSAALRKPQPLDIQRAQSLYGPSVAAPAPPPTAPPAPSPPDVQTIVITIAGSVKSASIPDFKCIPTG